MTPSDNHPYNKISIGGPVEERDGSLQLRIPLEESGLELFPFIKGAG